MQQADTRPVSRPDLGNGSLLLLLSATIGASALIIWLLRDTRPGDPLAQTAAAIGTLLLLVPAFFSWSKRRDNRVSTPHWFVAHVICSYLGVLCIAVHIAGGSLNSPAALVALALLFLILQGTLARALLGPRIAELFAASPASFGFGEGLTIDRQLLAQIIADKVALLNRLDSAAQEQTFSPALSHWIQHPVLAWRYQRLAQRESEIVGARSRAGTVLRWWRVLHIAIAVIFVVGMLIHLSVMLFFAGYAANDGQPYWWYLTAWG